MTSAAFASQRRRVQVSRLDDGKRLHLHDGPIDLILEVDADDDTAVRSAFQAATDRLEGLLDNLCLELSELRRPAQAGSFFKSATARRMHAAVLPFARDGFITPMAAVAGSVADTILDAVMAAQGRAIRKAYVNNGGDIAIYLGRDEVFRIGLIDRPDRPSLHGRALISGDSGVGGIATSGCRGRSFTLGIADAVTILAATAGEADAAATVIANAVNLPQHPGIARRPAVDLQPDSDLGARLVTTDVPLLSCNEINEALSRGIEVASDVLARGLAIAACLHLQGTTRTVHSRCPAMDGHQLMPTIGGNNAGDSAA